MIFIQVKAKGEEKSSENKGHVERRGLYFPKQQENIHGGIVSHSKMKREKKVTHRERERETSSPHQKKKKLMCLQFHIGSREKKHKTRQRARHQCI
jgi:hypothetical protein